MISVIYVGGMVVSRNNSAFDSKIKFDANKPRGVHTFPVTLITY